MTTVRNGIDISGTAQPNVDWAKIATDAGFVFIKATEGATFEDPALTKTRVDAARRHMGYRVGFYHFARPDNNQAVEEAEHFVKTVQAVGGRIGRNGVLDYEVAHPGNQDNAWINAWVDKYRKLTGQRPIIYGGSVLRENTSSDFNCPLWLAAYVSDPKPWVPASWRSGPQQMRFWQFTDRGVCKGVPGDVDRNEFFGSQEDLRRVLV